jgi:hypothetical protein
MSGLVGTLTGDGHADAPIGIRKVGERAGGIFHAIHFFVHLAMEELNFLQRMALWEIHAFRPLVLYAETVIARRRFSE